MSIRIAIRSAALRAPMLLVFLAGCGGDDGGGSRTGAGGGDQGTGAATSGTGATGTGGAGTTSSNSTGAASSTGTGGALTQPGGACTSPDECQPFACYCVMTGFAACGSACNGGTCAGPSDICDSCESLGDVFDHAEPVPGC